MSKGNQLGDYAVSQDFGRNYRADYPPTNGELGFSKRRFVAAPSEIIRSFPIDIL